MLEEIVSKRSRPVAIWLLAGVFMIIVQIILGGITRLTESGLSITEWQPLLGAVPPTSDAEWNKAFESYKQIAQYKHLHAYFTLDDFKSIFFWEWMHRVWGRLIGVVFAIPFVIFLVQKRFTKDMITPMIVLFLLGGLQGAIGWIMVKSGLNDENLYVSHIRLAIHFITALGLLVYTYWFALRLLVPAQQKIVNPASKNFLAWIIGLLVLQLVYGAFMAGLKAALAAPTWPDINGSYLPAGITSYQGKKGTFFSALVNNPVTVHFIHRNLAYLLTILILAWTVKVAKEKSSALLNRLKWLPLLFVLLQVTLGIATVLTSLQKVPQKWGVFEWNAQLHQAVAMFLLLALVSVFFLHTQKRSAAV
ncbi:MAG: heme A synthase [Chitinophagaceae bacterium]|nr:MAG: heme A synthase [Chitinophagaceae bacterium]